MQESKPLTVPEILDQMPEADRLPFLAWEEQRCRQRADLALLRELKQYRKDRNLEG